MSKTWSVSELGDQTGKTAIVTGANSGIGYYTALELGRAGATVWLACRDQSRGQSALDKLQAEAPAAKFRLELLDLSSLASVRSFVARFLDADVALDLLINNAGVMAIPKREETPDGFELQMGTNHFGHFALTGLLLPALKRAKAPRVVVVSSTMALVGTIDLENLQSEKRYSPSKTYGNSKLANLVFMLELARRAPWLTVTAAHPGGTDTNLQKYAFGWLTKTVGQHASMGALPTLRAAVDQVPSGTYFGPKGLFQMRGAPIQIRVPKRATKPEVAAAFFDVSEKLTNVHYASA